MSYFPSQPKRVMHLIWSLDLGGAEQVVMNLVSGLDRHFFEPVVCCLNDKGRYAFQVEQEGIRVIAMQKQPKFDPLLIPRLVRLIKREKIDLVHTHLFTSNLWGRIAALLAGVPVISTEHGMDVWRKRFHWTLDTWLARINRRVIFVSEGVKRFYSDRNPSINGKGRVLYNGIDVARFKKPKGTGLLLKNWGIQGSPRVIGTVGRLVPEKSQVDFIEAIQVLREEGEEVIGLLIGEGELEANLRKRVREASLENQMIFAGFRKDIADLYSVMDVFVICSTREGFPVTVLEAMAAGVPIVATQVGGILESIRDNEEGLLVPPGDSMALAQAIARILKDPGLRERLVQNAKARVEKEFSLGKMVRNHEALYQEVLAS